MGKRALVCDDLSSDRMLLGKILRKLNYEVIEAKSGKEGVQMALSHKPDVIFMDVVMPDMNGFQATREITKSEECKDIPVIIVSTKDRAPDKMNGKANGASGHLCKPVSEKDIENELKMLNIG
jgi:twitching motility two-component system response regulator PilH